MLICLSLSFNINYNHLLSSVRHCPVGKFLGLTLGAKVSSPCPLKMAAQSRAHYLSYPVCFSIPIYEKQNGKQCLTYPCHIPDVKMGDTLKTWKCFERFRTNCKIQTLKPNKAFLGGWFEQNTIIQPLMDEFS